LKTYPLPQNVTIEEKEIGGVITKRQAMFIGVGALTGFILALSLPSASLLGILFRVFLFFAIASGASLLTFKRVEEMDLAQWIALSIAYNRRPKEFLYKKGDFEWRA